MRFDARTLAKRGYYGLHSPRLTHASYALGYVFHTERVYDDALFEQLMRFCRRYRELTGARAMCALISPANPCQRAQAERIGQHRYAARFRQLAEVADLGYHGHYWYRGEPVVGRPGDRWFELSLGQVDEFSGMRHQEFHGPSFRAQIEEDLRWFEDHDIALEPFYCAGWWVLHEIILEELARRGFQTDFSFSRSPWFRNIFSHALMGEHSIEAGQPFRLRISQGPIGCVQNLIGCHSSPLIEDFVRNLNELTRERQGEVLGVLNSHDYDLDFENTLRCLRALTEQDRVRFLGYEALAAHTERLACIELP